MVSRSSNRRAAHSRGFTLVELMIVIGVILALLAIGVPMIGRAYRQAVRHRMAGDLQTIATALEAYKQDFGDYPRNDDGYSDSTLLYDTLMQPVAKRYINGQPVGQQYGPYLQEGSIKRSDSVGKAPKRRGGPNSRQHDLYQ